jgi:hypothetical protein
MGEPDNLPSIMAEIGPLAQLLQLTFFHKFLRMMGVAEKGFFVRLQVLGEVPSARAVHEPQSSKEIVESVCNKLT